MIIDIDVERIRSLVRMDLASRTGVSPAELVDEASLDEVGLDSLTLIEVLVSLQEEILAERGLSIDDVGESDSLPWLETVGDLVAFATSFVPSAGAPALNGAAPSLIDG